MDDLSSEIILNGADEGTLHDGGYDRDDDAHSAQSEPVVLGDTAKKPRSFRRGIFRAASIQDKILEKVISQMIPADSGAPPGQAQEADAPGDSVAPVFAERPGFTVATMSNNFRRFNARIGVVFKFQARAIRLLSWRRPSQTMSLLAVYTFVCLDPYLVCVLPLALALFGILVPSFIARRPAPASSPLGAATAGSNGGGPGGGDRVRNMGYSPRGPPLAPARTVKPVKELSRDFFRNMRDLQNCMEDFSVAHDQVIALVVPATNFSDEALSSAIFVLLFAAAAFMSIAAHLLPWRFLALAGGWVGICSGHPAVSRFVYGIKRQYIGDSMTGTNGNGNANGNGSKEGDNSNSNSNSNNSALSQALGAFEAFVRGDIILDDAPEAREVEIFELQRRSGGETGEWEAWLFSPSPYDPLSASRIAGERPRGVRFFEDVRPPEGWEWSEKKWALDLWSREWVEERIITGVEVETEAERWVYDMYNENEDAAGVVGTPVVPVPLPASWEEGGFGSGFGGGYGGGGDDDDEGGAHRTGPWRRRRWVRMVRRKNVSGNATA